MARRTINQVIANTGDQGSKGAPLRGEMACPAHVRSARARLFVSPSVGNGAVGGKPDRSGGGLRAEPSGAGLLLCRAVNGVGGAGVAATSGLAGGASVNLMWLYQPMPAAMTRRPRSFFRGILCTYLPCWLFS